MGNVPSHKRVLLTALASGAVAGQIVLAVLAITVGKPVSVADVPGAVTLVFVYGSLFGIPMGGTIALIAAAALRFLERRWPAVRHRHAWGGFGALIGAVFMIGLASELAWVGAGAGALAGMVAALLFRHGIMAAK